MKVEQSRSGELFVYYEQPRHGIKQTIAPGTKLIDARISGGRINGTAYVFKQGCPPAAYPVEGTAVGEGGGAITLTGPTPVWRGCQIVGFRPNGVHSRLEFTRTQAQAAQATPSWAEATSCDQQLPAIDRILSETRVEIATPRSGRATVGDRVVVSWSTEAPRRPVPAYLVVTASGAVRVDPTEHAIVLLPKARFPFGLSVEEQSTRIVVPLFGGVPRNGRILIELLTAGPQQVRAMGVGHAVTCGETRRVTRGDVHLVVEPGRPSVLAASDVDVDSTSRSILSSTGERLLRVHATWFQLIEVPRGAEIARIEGKEPRFSPTGRFVAFEALKRQPEHRDAPWSVFGLADTIDGKVLNQVRGEAVL